MVELKSLTVSIAAAVALKPSTIYSVKIDNSTTGQSWCVRRSYSEFYELRNKIIESLKDLDGVEVVHPLIFNLFPRRILFGSRRASVVKYRVVALQQFLRAALICISSPEVRASPPVYNQLSTFLQIFLSCPQTARRLGRASLPIRPGGRLLSGTPLGRSNSADFDSKTVKLGHVDQDAAENWTVAGDAVGLWAASNSGCKSSHVLRRLSSDPTVRESSPMVFRELILSKGA